MLGRCLSLNEGGLPPHLGTHSHNNPSTVGKNRNAGSRATRSEPEFRSADLRIRAESG